MNSNETKPNEKHEQAPIQAKQDYKPAEKIEVPKTSSGTVVGEMKPDESLRKDSAQAKKV
jgi:hypothetical protein